jgi:hypothetical protein
LKFRKDDNDDDDDDDDPCAGVLQTPFLLVSLSLYTSFKMIFAFDDLLP